MDINNLSSDDLHTIAKYNLGKNSRGGAVSADVLEDIGYITTPQQLQGIQERAQQVRAVTPPATPGYPEYHRDAVENTPTDEERATGLAAIDAIRRSITARPSGE